MAQRCPILHCCLLFLGSSWEGREGLEVNCQLKGRNTFRHQTHQTTSCFMWACMGMGQHLMPMAHGRRGPADLAFLWLPIQIVSNFDILIIFDPDPYFWWNVNMAQVANSCRCARCNGRVQVGLPGRGLLHLGLVCARAITKAHVSWYCSWYLDTWYPKHPQTV